MYLPRRCAELAYRLSWLLPLVAAVVAGLLVWVAVDLRRPPAAEDGMDAAVWPARTTATSGDWSVFRGVPALPAVRGQLSQRFRLAGTFFEFGEAGDKRKAIIDTLEDGQQVIVSEGDAIGEVQVVRILQEGVVLSRDGREEELWLSFSGSRAGPDETKVASAADDGGPPAGRFGRRVGEDRWVLGRESLLDYYTELLDHPDRLLQVFDSLKPLYDENRLITGYHLGVEGEGAFFDAVGLKQGDVVRKVNSLPMTNRRRAEYFIREFAGDRANAFVLDIEREGEPMKLVYEVR